MTDCMWFTPWRDRLHVFYDTVTWRIHVFYYTVTWRTHVFYYTVTWRTTRVLLRCDLTDNSSSFCCCFLNVMTDYTCFITLWLDRQFFHFVVVFKCHDGLHMFYYAVTWQTILLVLLLFLNVMTDYTCFITLWLDRQFFYFFLFFYYFFLCHDGLHMFYYAVTWQTILLVFCCCFLNVMTDYTCFITLWLDRQFF